MTRFPTAKTLEESLVIGVDESNNGGTPSGLPLIIVAYTLQPNQKNRNGIPHKGNGFPEKGELATKKKRRELFLKEALTFTGEYPDFVYGVIPRYKDLVWFRSVRVNATARVILDALPTNTDLEPIVIIDGKPFGDDVEANLNRTLQEYGAPPHRLFFRGNADHLYLPVKLADRVAYCIGALKVANPQGRWPFRTHRVNFNKLPKSRLRIPQDHYHE